MNILPYSLNFPPSLTFVLLHATIRRGGHTVGITSTVVAGCYYCCCYCSAVFLFVHLPPCRRSFRAGLFIYSQFAVIITLSAIIILLHICRCGVQCRDSVRSTFSLPTHFRQFSRRTSFSFSQRISEKRNQSPSRGARLIPQSCGSEPLLLLLLPLLRIFLPLRLSHLGNFLSDNG